MSKKKQSQNKPSDENQVENPETKVPTEMPDPKTEKIEVQEEVVSATNSIAEELQAEKKEPVIEFKEKIILHSEKQYYLDRLEEDKKIIKSLRAKLAESKKKIKDLEGRAV